MVNYAEYSCIQRMQYFCYLLIQIAVTSVLDEIHGLSWTERISK